MWKDKEKNNEYLNRVRARYGIIVSRISEQDMIEHLEANKPVNAYIKGLIRKDMESEAKEQD